MGSMNKQQRLREIDIIRSCVIFALIGCHAFAPFAGNWETPVLTAESTMYYWLAKFFYSGMLETFVFISGYVYALSDIKHNYTISTLIPSKIKRLYIPCLLWGVVCIIIYSGVGSLLSLKSAWIIMNGLGHLWFLPMLLWCFIFENLFCKRISFPKIWILIIIALLPCPELPLRINNSLYYLLFFHLGYLSFINRTKVFKTFQTLKKYFALFVLAYLVCFYVGTYMVEYTRLTPGMDLFMKILVSPFNKLSRLFYSIMAVGLYFIIGYMLSNCVSDWNLRSFNKISLASFGIYIFQEPILRILYYKTNFCQVMTPDFYPWVASLLTLMFSYILFYFFRKIPVLNKLF